MKYSEIAHLEQKELWKRFGQLKKKLFESKMQLKMQRLSNPLSIRFLRRDIARIQTALKKTQIQPAPSKESNSKKQAKDIKLKTQKAEKEKKGVKK